MARLRTIGVECAIPSTAVATEALDGRVGTGTVVRSTAWAHNDIASAKCTSPATPAAADLLIDNVTFVLGRTYYLRGYLYVPTLPAVATAIIANAATGYHGKLTPGGKLQLFYNATQIGSDSEQSVVAGGVYRVELGFRIGAGSGDDYGELRLNGVTVAGETGATRAVAVTSAARLGWVASPGLQADIYVDDVALNDSTGTKQNTFPGPCTGQTLLLPVADDPTTDPNQIVPWVAGAGGTTNLYDAVDNVPPAGIAAETNLTQIEHAGGGQTPAAGGGDRYWAQTATLAAQVGVQAPTTVGDRGTPTVYAAASRSWFGRVTTGNRTAQSFTGVERIRSVALLLRKTGAPTDNLVVELHNDSAGLPGATTLASASIPASAVAVNDTWTPVPLQIANLDPAATYWLVGTRSGATSDTDYYNAATGATYGAYANYDGSGWTLWTTSGTRIFFQLATSDGDAVVVAHLLYNAGEDVTTGAKLIAGEGIRNPVIPRAPASEAVEFGANVATGTWPAGWHTHWVDAAYDPLVFFDEAAVICVARPENAARQVNVDFMGLYIEYRRNDIGWNPWFKLADATTWQAKYVLQDTTFYTAPGGVETATTVAAGRWALVPDPLPDDGVFTSLATVTDADLKAGYTPV